MTQKIIIGLIIIVLIALGVWYGTYRTAEAPQNLTQEQTASSSDELSPGTSDESLDKDMTQIDAQINAYTSDSQSIDQGFTDTPGAQDNL